MEHYQRLMGSLVAEGPRGGKVSCGRCGIQIHHNPRTTYPICNECRRDKWYVQQVTTITERQ